MKSEDLYNAVTELRDDQVQAGEKKLRRGRAGDFRRVGAIAAVLAVVILTGVLAGPWLGSVLRGNPEQTGTAPTESTNASTANLNKFSLARASYPKMAPYPDAIGIEYGDYQYSVKFRTWKAEVEALHGNTNYSADLSDYLRTAVPSLLSGAGEENRIVSPLNLYVGLAMLAETTAGESREELLTLLNATDLDTLRTRAKALWQDNYWDDVQTTELLAASLWLRDDWNYNQETVNRLAQEYYGSVFSGSMGSEDYNTALQDWMNEQTRGLLHDGIGGAKMEPETVLSLVTTAYFQAEWFSEFNKTETGTFHGPRGDEACTFMCSEESGMSVCMGNGFLAGKKELKGSGSVFFVLPDQGLAPEDLLHREDFLDFLTVDLTDPERSRCETTTLHLTMPKFDVSSQLCLNEKLKELGVQKVFDEAKANFSPLSSDANNIALSKVSHGVRLSMDEKGVTGAAFTRDDYYLSAAEDTYLTLDRPFLFVVTNNEGLPIFVGIVNNPNA